MRPGRHALAPGGAGDARDYAQAAPGGLLSPNAQPRRLRATQLAPRLFAAARPLLDAQPDGVAYRLLGIAATELQPAEGADEEDMFVRDSGREKTREAAIAALRDRFGPTAVQRGLTFRPGPPTK